VQGVPLTDAFGHIHLLCMPQREEIVDACIICSCIRTEHTSVHWGPHIRTQSCTCVAAALPPPHSDGKSRSIYFFFFSFQLGTRAISGATVDIHIFFSSFFAAPPRLFLTEQWLKFTATARRTEAYCMFSLPSKQPFPIPTASSSPVAHAP